LGRWGSGGGGAGGAEAKPAAGGAEAKPESEAAKGSAAELLKPTTATIEGIVSRIPGAAEKIADAEAKLATGVSTDRPVSEGGFRQADGKWTSERAAVHDKILGEMFTPEKIAAAIPPPGEKPTLHLLGGRGGSGKGWFTKGQGTVDTSKAMLFDNDEFKAKLPEYQGWNAALLHEESRALGSAAERVARERGLNVVLDGTMRRTGSFERKVEQYKAAGYRVEGHYMFLAPEVATERAVKRFMNEGGRFVPPSYTLGSRTNEATFDAIKGKMDAWEIYDNSGSAPKLHSRSTR